MPSGAAASRRSPATSAGAVLRVLVVAEPPLSPGELGGDLTEVGASVVAEIAGPGDLAKSAVQHAPDVIVGVSASLSSSMFDAIRMVGTLAPCPTVVFTSDGALQKIERASQSGVHVYVVDGYAKHRLLPVMQVARTRFRHDQALREEVTGLTQRFEERKLVDRAKGLLMRSRAISEEEAFDLLRESAMRNRQRIGVMAQSIIEMSRAAEAVNRAGQLRMLSQRAVKCYAQSLVEPGDPAVAAALAECVERVGANLATLGPTIEAAGYSDLVGRVVASWRIVEAICAGAPRRDALDDLDEAAEAMLRDAESLTGLLEASGLVDSLKIVNASGRLRMLSQRAGKLCFLLAIEPRPTDLVTLGDVSLAIRALLDGLAEAPLSTDRIRSVLAAARSEWDALAGSLADKSQTSALGLASAAADRLLAHAETLTSLYEQAMQVLVGNRIGQLRL